MKKVQDKWKSEGKDIAIWYTLPILPTGLTPEGMNVLSDAKAKGVELAGVNVMTMDYGNAICQSANTEGQNIHGKCATSAIANLHSQLKGLHPNKSDAEIDAMMGTTPMVGVNDVQGEVFYLSDARLVMQDAQKRNLGMVGIWSIARDLPGGTNLSPEFHGLTKEQAPKMHLAKSSRRLLSNKCVGDTFQYRRIFVNGLLLVAHYFYSYFYSLLKKSLSVIEIRTIFIYF